MLVKRESCGSVVTTTTERSTQSVVDFDKSFLVAAASAQQRGEEALTPPLSPLSQPSCGDASTSGAYCYGPVEEVVTRTAKGEGSGDHVDVVAPDETNDCSKPFFIMDWLEQVNEQDLELAQQMLQTPQKGSTTSSYLKSSASSDSSTDGGVSGSPPVDARPGAPRKTYSTPPRKPPQPPSSSSMRSTATPPPSSFSSTCFRKRSIAIGNGWNAKGLQKAKLGHWDAALSCWENALEIRVQVLGEDHPDVANTCSNIGIGLGKVGRTDEAMAMLKRALRIRVERYGLVSKEVAAGLHNLGNVLQQSGNLSAAVKCFSETRKLQEQVFGPRHVQVARACVAMGQTYRLAGEHNDALEAYGDALSIFRGAEMDESNLEVRNVLEDVTELRKIVG